MRTRTDDAGHSLFRITPSSEMSAGVALKKALCRSLERIGFLDLLVRNVLASDVAILMYHRVVVNTNCREPIQDGMYVTPNTFKEHLQYLIHRFHVISAAEFHELAFGSEKPRRSNDKPYCLLTFDDGWLDFYENAFPMLQRYGIPATVFLTTGFIGTDAWPWPDRLARILASRRENRMESGRFSVCHHEVIAKIESCEGNPLDRLEEWIAIIKTSRLEEIDRLLDTLAHCWQVDVSASGRAFLSWEEAREMHRSGLITFGSHTERHAILTTLIDREIRDEVIRSRDRLFEEGIADPSFVTFSYPNGNYNDAITAIVRNAGYHLAFTTKKGRNRIMNGTDAYRLKRIAVHQDIASCGAMLGGRMLTLI